MQDNTRLIETICKHVSKRMPNNALAPIHVQQERLRELSKVYKLNTVLKNHISRNILGI